MGFHLPKSAAFLQSESSHRASAATSSGLCCRPGRLFYHDPSGIGQHLESECWGGVLNTAPVIGVDIFLFVGLFGIVFCAVGLFWVANQSTPNNPPQTGHATSGFPCVNHDSLLSGHEEGQRSESPPTREQGMELGAFSISLAVKDLEASRQFYEKFGFKVFGGDPSRNWLILKNGAHVIGLFQGMFDKNILTFNPGWDQNAQQLAAFTDVRELQRQLKAQGVPLVQEADESTKGPASFIAVDPDGNPILVDQHV
jgi:catechol 2,3-dioxygenase-like lactoylglutathione lyase family enzyme